MGDALTNVGRFSYASRGGWSLLAAARAAIFAPVHDERYKTLFAFPRMVEDLLRGFAVRDIAGEDDFSALRLTGELIEVSEGLLAGLKQLERHAQALGDSGEIAHPDGAPWRFRSPSMAAKCKNPVQVGTQGCLAKQM